MSFLDKTFHRSTWLVFCSIAVAWVGTETTSVGQRKKSDEGKSRVRRPEFKKEEWTDVFFEDLFAEGLRGDRPAKVVEEPAQGSGETPSAGDGTAWSDVIDRDTVENEVKALQQKLQKLGLSVSRFNTQFREIQQQFSLLSMMFSIIHEYDSEIRWKKYALSAQKMFAEAASKSRAPSKAAFEHAKLRKQDLQQLVRGGAIDVAENQEQMAWPNVIDRTTIMVRLEQALQNGLKPESSDEKQFKKSKELLWHQAQLISAMGKVITLEDMDEADEDDYVEYANEMVNAAQKLSQAIEADDFNLASESINRIEQSCNDCHGDWR